MTDPDRNSRWRGGDSHDVGRLLRRLWNHLTRRGALIALILAAAAAGLAALVGPATAVGQVLLVLVGILASVVVLPEEPHRLWNVSAEDLAATVPTSQLLTSSERVAAAIGMQAQTPVPSTVVEQHWVESLDKLNLMLEDAARCVTGMDYAIQVTPQPEETPLVSASISCARCVPGAANDEVWFSFCSNSTALGSEFAEHSSGCLSREIVELDRGEGLDEWLERVEQYHVELAVDGHIQPVARRETIDGGDWRVRRIYFQASGISKGFLSTELNAEFHAGKHDQRFPVKFSAYGVYGATQVTFEVLDRDAVVEIDEYISAVTRHVSVTPITSARSRGFKIRAAPATVLPAGTGAVFSWVRAQPSSVVSPTSIQGTPT